MKGRHEYKTYEENFMCERCSIQDVCQERCEPYKLLLDVIKESDDSAKYDILMSYKEKLVAEYSETSEEYKSLGDMIIDKFDIFDHIRDLGISIGYVLSYESKLNKGRMVYGTTKKASNEMKAYLPYDFIITIYEPHAEMLSDNQKKVLMMHELRHIEMGMRGLKIRDHDVEDFAFIIKEFGCEWNDKEVPDILGEGFEFKETLMISKN